MRKAALHNLGCKVNAYETEAMQQLLEAAGYTIVDFEETADVYIVNTCSVTNTADKKSRQMLHRARSRNPEAVVVAAGCYVQAAGPGLSEDAAVDLVVGNNKKGELIPLLEEYFRTRRASCAKLDISSVQEYESLQIDRTAEHTRAFIKIQDGCNQFCSYCIIPYTRGRIRSRDIQDIEREVQRLAANGYHEVVLTGIHLSSYGLDLAGKETGLLTVLQRIHGIRGIERIRLGSLEPRLITEEFAAALSRLPKLCPHFHLSLQSGCDETLKRMNRHYTCEDYLARCGILRRYFERPAITTDVIVGFAGETEEEFEATKAFLQQVGFYEMHVFKYSRRAGTRADKMPDQVPEPVKTRRSGELLSLGNQMSGAYRQGVLGQEKEILLEEPVEINGRCYMTGYTKEYVRAAVLLDKTRRKNAKNCFVSGIMKEFLTDDLIYLAENASLG